MHTERKSDKRASMATDVERAQGGVPALDVKRYAHWKLRYTAMCQRYKSSHEAIQFYRPRMDEEEYDATLDAEGNATEATVRLVAETDRAARKWIKKNEVCYSLLIQAIESNPVAMQMVLQSGIEIMDMMDARFNIHDTKSTQAELAKFNQLKIQDKEKGESFITRIQESQLILANHGQVMDPEIHCLGRLIAGLEESPRYGLLAKVLKVAIGMTWERAITEVILEDAQGEWSAPAEQVRFTNQQSHGKKPYSASHHSGGKKKSFPPCTYCKKTNHSSEKCFRKPKQNKQPVTKRAPGHGLTCYNCGIVE